MLPNKIVNDPSIKLVPITMAGVPATDFPTLDVLIQDLCASTAALYEVVEFHPPWIGYLAISDSTVVGTCAFKSPPHDGRVEIAYFTLPEYEGRGFATAMARTLIQVAHEADPQITVAAQTLPGKNPSCSILEKLGFTHVGSITDPEVGEVWEWQLLVK